MMDELILLALLIGAYTFFMPLIALWIAKKSSKDVKELRAELNLLKSKSISPTSATEAQQPEVETPGPDVKVAAKTTPTAVKTDQEDAPTVILEPQKPIQPTKPATPSFFARMSASFQANWVIWMAAISLACGGLFIVQYGLERGFLGPVARVLTALGFGASLLGVATYLSRKPNIGMEGLFTVPVALAAGGIASLYGGVVSAHILYDLTSPLIGFASMVAVSFLAVGTGLIFGPVLAVVGILGAFISPLIVTDGESTPILYLYFLSVLVTALAVERYRQWIWLSAVAVAFSLFWGLALSQEVINQPYLAAYCVAIILTATTVPAFGIWPKWDSNVMLDEKSLSAISIHYPTILTVLTAAGATTLLAFMASSNLFIWQTALLVFAGLIAWSIYWCNRTENLDQIALIFAGGMVYSVTAGNPLFDYYFEGDRTSYFTFESSVLGVSAVLFMIAAFWRTPRSSRPLYWIANGTIAPVAAYFIAYANWHDVAPIPDRVWTFIAVLLAAFLASSAILMLRSKIRHRRMGADLFFAGMLITTSYAAYLTFERDYLSHTAALLSLGALALVIQYKFKWTGHLIWAFTAAATSLIVFDLFPDYSLQQPVIWVISVFGIAAALFYTGYMMAQKASLQNRAVLYETAFLLTIALLVCALIARVATNGKWEFSYMVLGLYATVWILLAGVQFRRMIIADKLNIIRQCLGLGYGLLGMTALLLSIMLSPLTTSIIKGVFPIDTVMAAYFLPTAIFYALYHFNLLPKFINRKIALGFTAIMAGFIAVLEVRRFWHGPNIRLVKGAEVGELYTYTILMLTATIVTVLLAITRKNPNLRKIGLGLAALTAAKVFLWDTAGMQGLARATVFIILGLASVGYCRHPRAMRIKPFKIRR